MKIIKRILIALVVLVVLFIGAGFVASQFINKELVENQVLAATGREFKITGDLKPLLSLSPSIEAEGVSMANAKWGSKPQLATIGKFDIKMQLLPLLEKKIVVDKVDIDQADILLEQKDGQWNFTFEQTAATAENEKDKPVSQKSPLSFDVASLNITNSKLTIIQGAGAPTVVEVKTMKLAPHDKEMNFEFDGTANNKPVKISVDLPPLADLMSAKTADIKNLNVTSGSLLVTAQGSADFNAKKINFSSIAIQQGDIKLNGSISADASGKVPYIKGNLSADSITVKPAAKDEKAAPEAAPAAKTASSNNDKLSLDQLSAANADLQLNIGKLVSGNIELDKIVATLKLSNGVLTINPLSAGFANGQIVSSLSLSKGGMRVNLKASNLLMEKILAETADNNDFKNGVTNADVSLSGTGDSVAALENSLSGTSKFTVGKGTYSGQILKGHAAQLVNLLTGGGAKQIDLNCAVTSINWTNGTGNLQQMGVDTNNADLTGSGSIRLPDQSMNLVLTPTPKIVVVVDSIVVPWSVTGTFSNPSVMPMAGKALVSTATGVISDVAKQGGKINLSGLLGGKSNKKMVNNTSSPCATAQTPAADNTAATNTNNAQTQQQTPQSKLNKKLQKWGF